jgi:GH24 family phage-related lysozyme (muramidase)
MMDNARAKWWRLVAMLAVLVLLIVFLPAGGTQKVTVTAPHPVVTYIPPESAITPEGARPLPSKVGLTLTLTNTQIVTPAVLLLLEREEGYDRCAYWDPFGLVWTVGFGQTHLNGRGVPAMFCFASRTAAVDNLKFAIEHEGYLDAVVAVVGRSQPPGVYTGEISFVYNLGAGIYTGILRADLERHDYQAACAIQRQYDHAGGIVLPDLKRRRIHECEAILAPTPKPPSHAQRQRELNSKYRYRNELRQLLGGRSKSNPHGHDCRRPPYRHPLDATRQQCDLWGYHGNLVNRSIAEYHARYHVY